MIPIPLVPAVTGLTMGVLSLAMALAVLRLIWGPSLPDRVVALELLTAIAVGLIAVYSIATGERVLLDVAIVLALITFLGTVAFSRYIEKSTQREQR